MSFLPPQNKLLNIKNLYFVVASPERYFQGVIARSINSWIRLDFLRAKEGDLGGSTPMKSVSLFEFFPDHVSLKELLQSFLILFPDIL